MLELLELLELGCGWCGGGCIPGAGGCCACSCCACWPSCSCCACCASRRRRPSCACCACCGCGSIPGGALANSSPHTESNTSLDFLRSILSGLFAWRMCMPPPYASRVSRIFPIGGLGSPANSVTRRTSSAHTLVESAFAAMNGSETRSACLMGRAGITSSFHGPFSAGRAVMPSPTSLTLTVVGTPGSLSFTGMKNFSAAERTFCGFDFLAASTWNS
mmetsp:Transcript_47708/g.113548  ORF Transcript_47708/g.113548 Transcript_47708/m.113548 type:complete len:218 (+) Transcript_47708:567-1220(+)